MPLGQVGLIVGRPYAGCTAAADAGRPHEAPGVVGSDFAPADFTQGVSVSFSAAPDADRDLMSGEEWLYLRWEPESDV